MSLATTRYETRPIQSWEKATELRRLHGRRRAESKAKGEVIAIGVIEQFMALLAGFGEFGQFNPEPEFTNKMRTTSQAVECIDEAERRGFIDICTPLKIHLGGTFLGHLNQTRSGPIKPDLVFTWHLCQHNIKGHQVIAEHLGIPFWAVDVPYRQSGGPTRADSDYLVNHMQEGIARMEKALGRKFDDEKLIAATWNEWRCMANWAKIYELLKARPAPLDYRQLWVLRLPNIEGRHEPEVADYSEFLLAEVAERVRDGISARGFEDARLAAEGVVPFHRLEVLKWPEEYGAIYVAGEALFTTFAAWTVMNDGSWRAAKTPEERGTPLRTREDALRALADLYIGSENDPRPTPYRLESRPLEDVRRAQDWHCDGVVAQFERFCRNMVLDARDRLAAYREAGIPAVEFDGSQCDPRDFSEEQARSAIESLLEGLGLAKVAAVGEETD